MWNSKRFTLTLCHDSMTYMRNYRFRIPLSLISLLPMHFDPVAKVTTSTEYVVSVKIRKVGINFIFQLNRTPANRENVKHNTTSQRSTTLHHLEQYQIKQGLI